jgi:hypothetical protein
MIARLPGTMMAAPMPWMARKAISTPALGASAQASDAARLAPRLARRAGMAMARIEPSMKPRADARIAAISTNRRRFCGQNASLGRGPVRGTAAASLGDLMEPA